jgi:preprotein translocase subunit YajC
VFFSVLTLLLNSVLFAQGAEPQGDANAFPRMMLLIMGFGLLMYFLMLRPQKRKEEEFRRMVSQLKENDHVVTAGGIHGVVTNVQREAERVTIRVDESTGTKLRVSTSSIARVISDEADETKVSDGGAK